MFGIYHIFLLLTLPYASFSSRRITGGRDLSEFKRYAVYFLKAPKAEVQYTGWTCAGAIVSPLFILTSASCVEDVQFMYAIAGYNKFVTESEMEDDPCTKSRRKKVVLTCVPKSYKFSYEKIDNWARIDIAVVKVESPYDFEDSSYANECSYVPAPISVNYEPGYQRPGVDAIMMGWGHTRAWRKISDKTVYNNAELIYASTKIMDKNECKKYYDEVKSFEEIIDNWMICTLEPGNLDDKGDIIKRTVPLKSGCISKVELMLGVEGSPCDGTNERIAMRAGGDSDINIARAIRNKIVMSRANETNAVTGNITRRQDGVDGTGGEGNEGQDEVPPDTQETTVETKNHTSMKASHTPGLCQNDHGAPLVTWIGAREVLIGIGSVFKIDENLQCVGPYLFTSTQCNGKFLECILNIYGDNKDMRRRCNKMLRDDGIEVVERRVSWIGHPAGPAENEIIEERPQRPLHEFNG